MATHYNDPIDQTPGRLAGYARDGGKASPEVIAQAQQIIINEARNAKLNDHDIAYVLAVAEKESSFNPDAANKTSSAFGLGQTMDGTASRVGYSALTLPASTLLKNGTRNVPMANIARAKYYNAYR